MSITITKHESGHYFISKWEGRITNSEFIPSYAAFMESDDWRPGLPELCDIYCADLSQLTNGAIIGLARWAESFYRQKGVVITRTAIYLPEGVSRASAIIYDVWTTNSPEFVRTFQNRDEALSWLTEKV